ncbi:hypothetical protein [Phytoactinopolyspora limicola]|uniref:hypothetical protein n=1 Tax=Phytoactinopolyspora limicola TaxID=2715536 RepID=UPI0014072D8B|nr:hypothetical protein [Phytoactinopolyspora limicola]
MSGERDEDKAWADLVDAFHSDPEPREGTQRWPAAENIDVDEQLDSPSDTAAPVGRRPDDDLLDGGDLQPDGDLRPDGDLLDEDDTDTPQPDPFAGVRPFSTYPAAGPAEPEQPARTHQPDPGDAYLSDGDHFVPPDPPPLPRGDRVTRWAWTGLIGAPALLLLATVMGWTPSSEVMFVMAGGFVAGFVTLISRMRGRNPHDPDDGAVV